MNGSLTRARRLRRGAASAVAAAAMALTATAASAAPPNANTGAGIAVDGVTSDWNLQADYFSDMIRAGGNGGQTTVESKLYMRYDCQAAVMYVLVLPEPGVSILSGPAQNGDNFVKFGNTDKRVDAGYGDDGVAPDFHYVSSNGVTASGWEASFPLENPFSATNLNVHAQVEHGGAQTSAVPGRAIPLVVTCGYKPPLKPLQVTKTAAAAFVRTFDWSVSKQATPQRVSTLNDTTTFSYTVAVTKGPAVDSGFAVAGDITVTNPNGVDVGAVDVVDELAGGQDCPLTGATDLTVPAGGSVTIPYSCALPAAVDGTNQATATWPGGSASGQAAFTFGAPTSVVNATVDVTDAFDGGLPVLIPGGGQLSESATFTYTRTVAVPASGCRVYPNVATITSPNELVKSASASVEACRESAIIGTPNAKLSVSKRGPKRATAGQVVTFTIVLRNTSATAATSVVLNDILPSGYTFYRVPKGARLVKGKLVWNVGTLAAGGSTTVKVQARIAKSASGTRCNTAVASAGNAPTVRSRACTTVLRVAGAVRVPGVTG